MADPIQDKMALASTYADALFDLAEDAGKTVEVRGEMEELLKIGQIDPQFMSYMFSGLVPWEERAATYERVFRGRLNDLLLNTLQVMNRNGRHGLMRELHAAYSQRERQSKNQVAVLVISATELAADLRTDVEAVATELSGRRPIIEYRVDPGLLGGLIVQIGDVRYDYSVRRHLRETRQLLAERSERGLTLADAA